VLFRSLSLQKLLGSYDHQILTFMKWNSTIDFHYITFIKLPLR